MRPQIMIAPNGARRGRADHPALPITIAETVAVAQACQVAGADALHLHVRDGQGAHTLDAGLYIEALVELARATPGLEIQISSESAGRFSAADQLHCLAQVRPTWASVSVREIARAPELAARLYRLCADQGTRVQHILYDNHDAATLESWRDRGWVPTGTVEVILVLGQYGPPVPAAPEMLAPRLAALPHQAAWAVCAFGPQEQACLLAAARRGGQLRIGFENNLLSPDGQPWADMAEAVRSLRSALDNGRADIVQRVETD